MPLPPLAQPPASSPAPAVIALVPLRLGGKSRLATRLDPRSRALLALAMLDDVVRAVRDAGVTDVRILCGDTAARRAASERGLTAIDDPPAAGEGPEVGLRAAVDRTLAVLGTRSVRLIVAADLPLLSAEDVRVLLARNDRVSVAPTRGGGTGVLVLPPGTTFASAYGPGSAAAHLHAARAASATGGLAPQRIDREGTAWDLDRPEDLDLVAPRLDPDSATAAVLRMLRG